MKFVLIATLLLFLNACAGSPIKEPKFIPPAKIPTGVIELEQLPAIDGPIITVAVYGFGDKTGQRKPSSNFSQLSTAVTQGAENYVIQALQKAGKGKWFKVLERTNLDNLVKERQLIRSTREIYEGKETKNDLKPMLFAGLLIEGAIVGYDSNVQTGGVGARYFGIGTSKEYRTDRVSVIMRIISVNTGEILLSVGVDKTIASYKDSSDIFRFLDLGTRALEIEIGSSINEPVNYAVQMAIEQSIVEIVKEGEKKGLWKFKKDKHPLVTDGDIKLSLKTNEKPKKLPVSKLDIKDIPKVHTNDLHRLDKDNKFNVCNKDGWCFQSTKDLYNYESIAKGHNINGQLHGD